MLPWSAPSSKPPRYLARSTRVHLARRGYLLIVLIALLGIAGTWSDDPAFASAWSIPAFLLLAGLAFEAWYARGTRVSLRMVLDERLKLGHRANGAFGFGQNRNREVELLYARVLPAAFEQGTDVKRVTLAAGEET